ncbi:MAG: hypothetical protein Q9183_005330 [Haloplaca sp. 2 TL-2023]
MYILLFFLIARAIGVRTCNPYESHLLQAIKQKIVSTMPYNDLNFIMSEETSRSTADMTPPSTTPPQSSPFLRLPIEVRCQIYEHLIPSCVRLYEQESYDGLKWEGTEHTNPPALALVCRQISTEYLMQYYSNVTIYLNLHDGLWTWGEEFSTTQWIQSLNRNLASCIRRVIIKARIDTSRKSTSEMIPLPQTSQLPTKSMDTKGYAIVEYIIQWIPKAQRFVISQNVLDHETTQNPVLPDRCETFGFSDEIDLPAVGLNGTDRLLESMGEVLRKAKVESAEWGTIGLGRDALGELLELVLENQSLEYLCSNLTEQELVKGDVTSIQGWDVWIRSG